MPSEAARKLREDAVMPRLLGWALGGAVASVAMACAAPASTTAPLSLQSPVKGPRSAPNAARAPFLVASSGLQTTQSPGSYTASLHSDAGLGLGAGLGGSSSSGAKGAPGSRAMVRRRIDAEIGAKSGKEQGRSTSAEIMVANAFLAEVAAASPRSSSKAPSKANSPAQTSEPLPEIGDPNDGAFLPAPRGQLSQRPAPEAQLIAPQPRPQRRYALTLAPTFARLKLPMIGRTPPFSGLGWQLEAEVALVEWLSVHAGWQRAYFLVPATGELEDSGNKSKPTAARGWLRWQDFSVGLRYVVDTGKILPRIEAGAALAGIQSPAGVQDGQSGQSCAGDNRCDSGLVCNTQTKKCEAVLTPLAFAGLGAEYFIGRYFGVGALLRYYLSTGGLAQRDFGPLQWNFQLRLSLRY